MNLLSLTCTLPPQVSQKNCFHCKAQRQYFVPRPQDCPEALRGLSEEACRALSPLEIDTGIYVRAKDGYRQHTGMIRFNWCAARVPMKLREIADRDMRAKAKAAYKFLKASEASSYREFHDEHKIFLREHPRAEERQRRRWTRFIERAGIECALWPTLFWDTRLCVTWERSTNPRRKANYAHQSLVEFMEGEASESDDTSDLDLVDAALVEGPPASTGAHSTKRAFMALALAPDVSVGASYEVLHFVYDLNLWSSIGAKRNLQGSTPMRVLLKGESFSPLYWRKPHLALLDLVRQRGYPQLFWTQAPYEWSMPYHISLRDNMSKQLCERLRLPLHETLHQAHVLTETAWTLLSGQHKGKKDNAYQIVPATDADGKEVDFAPFLRLEFQDGTHKLPTQDYHGSGRPHTHMLGFGDHPADWQMHHWASATLPPEDQPEMRGYVLGSQTDRDGKSQWPVHEERSYWDEVAETYRLHHTADDNACGRRAYATIPMEGAPCHQDLQYDSDGGAFRAYLTKYVSKFSDAATDEILGEDSDMGGDATAAAILYRYRPMEPEMVLQLFGSIFKQWKVNTASGGARQIQVPWPGKEDITDAVMADIRAYEAAAWKGDSMSLLDFLRKSCDGGRTDIAPWLKSKHAEHIFSTAYAFHKRKGGSLSYTKFCKELKDARKEDPSEPPLEEMATALMAAEGAAAEELPQSLHKFVQDYKVHGEKLVCCEMRSRASDEFYGQWLVLHVPFQSMADFLQQEIDERVPSEHRCFAMAMRCQHPIALTHWAGEVEMQQEMRMEGHTRFHIKNVTNYFSAHKSLIDAYMDGRISKDAITGLPQSAAIQRAVVMPERATRLPIQERFATLIPHEKDVEARINKGKAAEVREGDVLLLGSVRARVLRIHCFDNFRDMLQALGVRRALPMVRSVEKGVEIYHKFRGYERQAQQHGVVAFELGPADEQMGDIADATLYGPQQRAYGIAWECVQRALRVHNAATERESDIAREDTWQHNKINVIDGPPGTGKTFVQHYLIHHTLAEGGKVLYLFLTAQLASRMREKFGNAIDIDTLHAAIGDGREGYTNPHAMAPYTLVMVDECYHFSYPLFKHFVETHNQCDRVPCACLAGDKHQMGGPGGCPAFLMPLWRKVTFTTTLRQDPKYKQRCQDPMFLRLLNGLRLDKPAPRGGKGLTVAQICRGHKAWRGDRPTVDDIRRLFSKHPDTTILTVSRLGATEINELALQAKFPRREPLAILPGDIECNPENYDAKGELIKEFSKLKPLQVPIHKGMLVYLTRNVRKDVDFVNGMLAKVEDYDVRSMGLRVLTTTGKRVQIWRWTDKDLGNASYYPLRPGYASTILKFQGAELAHVTAYLDVAGVPGAAYTALSRVATSEQYLIGGNVNPHHFTPRNHAYTRQFTRRQIKY